MNFVTYVTYFNNVFCIFFRKNKCNDGSLKGLKNINVNTICYEIGIINILIQADVARY